MKRLIQNGAGILSTVFHTCQLYGILIFCKNIFNWVSNFLEISRIFALNRTIILMAFIVLLMALIAVSMNHSRLVGNGFPTNLTGLVFVVHYVRWHKNQTQNEKFDN